MQIVIFKMQDSYNMLIEFFKSLPTWGKISVLPFMFLTYLLFKYIIKNKKAQISLLVVLKKFIKNLSRKDLHSHFLFIDIEKLQQKTLSLNFNDANKNFIFQTILICNIEAVKAKVNNFLDSKNYYKFDNKCLAYALIKLTIDIVKEYEDAVFKKIEEHYRTKDYVKIYNVVMDSPNGFKSYNQEHVDMLIMHIEKISYSSAFDDNYEKMSLFLDMIDIVLQMSMLKVEKTFKDFNGEFHDLFK